MRGSLRRALATTLTLALVSACTTSSGSDNSSASPPPSPPTTNAAQPAPTTEAAASAGSGPDTTPAAGATATIRRLDGSALDATLSVVKLPDVALPAGVVAAGAAVQVSVADGVVIEPVTLDLPGVEPPPGAMPVVAHLNDAGSWELDPAQYAAGVYRADVSSFSIRVPAWLNPVEWVDGATDWLTGRTDPPADCDTDPYGWVLAGAPPVDGTFHACVRANPTDSGAERVEVKIKSNRAMAMWITLPEHPYEYLWVEQLGDWESIAWVITELDAPGGLRRVLLPPGRTMTLGYTRPADGGPRLDFSSYQNNTTQLVSLVQKYIGDKAILGSLAAMLLCVTVEAARAGRDVRYSELALQAAIICLLEVIKDSFAGAPAELLGQAYAVMVEQGRVHLSSDATDNIERMLADAETVRRFGAALNQLGALANKLTLAQALADVATMLHDSALALMPGLNLYTVFFVGAGPGFDLPAVCDLRATRWTAGDHPDSADPGPWASGTTVTGDVDGDGRGDTVWATVCGAGTVAARRDVHVFDADRRLIGTLPVRDAVGAVYGDLEVHALEPTIGGGTITVEVWVWDDGDAVCCPSIAFPLSFAVTNAGFELMTPVPPPAGAPTAGEAPAVEWDGVWREKTGSGRVVQLGIFGEQVRWLQEQLVLREYEVDVDGYFGAGTEQAVRQFQRDRGLTVNGIATEEVWDNFGE